MPKTTRTKKPRKPDRIRVGPLSAHPRKPPGKRDQRWWWQVIYYEGRTQVPALAADGSPAHRRGSSAEIKAYLNERLEQGGWKQPVKRQVIPEELTVDQLCRLWLAHEKKRRDLGKSSAMTYENHFRWWKNHISPGLGHLPLHALTAERLQDWVDGFSTVRTTFQGRKMKGYAPRSVRNFFHPLRSAWEWGRKKGTVPHPLPSVELPKIDGYIYSHHTPTLADAYAVVEQLSGWRRVAARLYLLTGARFGEIAELTWPAWDREQRTLTLSGKTGERVVPTGKELQRELLEWWVKAGQPANGALLGVRPATLRGLHKDLARASEAIHTTPFSAQGFRRLASTRLIAMGPEKVPVKEYEAAMGHSYTMGLRTYAEACPQRLKAVMTHLETTG